MKILVTGDRNWTSYEVVRNTLVAIMEEFAVEGQPLTLIHGAAKGADTIAGEIADGLDFKVVPVPADWERYGKAAGPIRNLNMLDMLPELVLAFHNDLENSKGTRNCVEEAKKRDVPVLVISSGDKLEEPAL
jgi:hypothetical protein